MRIGILEWICGGGLQETEPARIAQSLLNEGQAMLQAVAQDFASCGHDVFTSVDARLDGLSVAELESQFQVLRSYGFTNGLPSSWWRIASEADAVVVIAPEFAGILQTAISKLKPVCKLLLNCSGYFLAATCDKWLTAQRLEAVAIPHPHTQLAVSVTESWLDQHCIESGNWIIKPRDGAGCDAIQLTNNSSLRNALNSIRTWDLNSQMILQPLHTGTAFSRSAIVDSTGRSHWLPLVTQEFTASDSMSYTGGRVLDVGNAFYEDKAMGKRYLIDRLDEVLNATIGALGPGALGWVGVDLLYSDELRDWVVIEINPRLTTSFAGLHMAYGSGLMEQVLRGAQGLPVAIKPTWKSLSFNAAGKRI